jgi:putative addiction module CopG family antidote
MNVSLSPELERLVAEKLRSGRYNSADDVIREGLELLQAQDSGAIAGPAKDSPSIAEVFAKIAGEVPEGEWDKVPSDLSKNLEHYLYGSRTDS